MAGNRPIIGPTCSICGRAMVSRRRDLPTLSRMLGRPLGPDWFCVIHGPWPREARTEPEAER